MSVGNKKLWRSKLCVGLAVSTLIHMLQGVVLIAGALVGSWQVVALLAADTWCGLALVDILTGGLVYKGVACVACAHMTDGKVHTVIAAATVVCQTFVLSCRREKKGDIF